MRGSFVFDVHNQRSKERKGNHADALTLSLHRKAALAGETPPLDRTAASRTCRGAGYYRYLAHAACLSFTLPSPSRCRPRAPPHSQKENENRNENKNAKKRLRCHKTEPARRRVFDPESARARFSARFSTPTRVLSRPHNHVRSGRVATRRSVWLDQEGRQVAEAKSGFIIPRDTLQAVHEGFFVALSLVDTKKWGGIAPIMRQPSHRQSNHRRRDRHPPSRLPRTPRSTLHGPLPRSY